MTCRGPLEKWERPSPPTNADEIIEIDLGGAVDGAGEGSGVGEDDEDYSIFAACSALERDGAGDYVEGEEYNEATGGATEAELFASLPKPVLSLNDRVEVFWDGDNEWFAGKVVGFAGSRVEVFYDDGEEGSCDMEEKAEGGGWRLEGDGAGDDAAGEESDLLQEEQEKSGAEPAFVSEDSKLRKRSRALNEVAQGEGIKRPQGRAPKGKILDRLGGTWSQQIAVFGEDEEQKIVVFGEDDDDDDDDDDEEEEGELGGLLAPQPQLSSAAISHHHHHQQQQQQQQQQQPSTTRKVSISSEDRAELHRARNRDHARNTRLRKKAYVEELKRTLNIMVAERESHKTGNGEGTEKREERVKVLNELWGLWGKGSEDCEEYKVRY